MFFPLVNIYICIWSMFLVIPKMCSHMMSGGFPPRPHNYNMGFMLLVTVLWRKMDLHKHSGILPADALHLRVRLSTSTHSQFLDNNSLTRSSQICLTGTIKTTFTQRVSFVSWTSWQTHLGITQSVKRFKG